MIDLPSVYIEKAARSLAGAESEYQNGRYENCANRCYYSCFQAAVAALLRAGIRPPGSGQWSHAFVPSQFDGVLVGRRKLYPSDLSGALQRCYSLRRAADYEAVLVTQTQARRALARSRVFVDAIVHAER